MKVIVTEQQLDNVIDKFITYKLEPHKVKVTKKYPGSIFWIKNGKVIAEIIKKTGEFWVSDVIWETILRMFSLDYDEIQQIIKNWLEKHYKLKGLSPLTDNTLSNYQFEEHENHFNRITT